MMPETIPDIRTDKGFQKDAELYAESMLRNKSIPIEDVYASLKNLVKSAYLHGGQSGFNAGWRIKEMRSKNEYNI